jgi:hypothetical protein
MEMEDDEILPSHTDFVDGGGFFAMSVLAIGIPFN